MLHGLKITTTSDGVSFSCFQKRKSATSLYRTSLEEARTRWSDYSRAKAEGVYSRLFWKGWLLRSHNNTGKRFQFWKKCIHSNSKLSDMFLLTEGVVDDLKQSKVAGCYAVHPEFHNHSLKKKRETEWEWTQRVKHSRGDCSRSWLSYTGQCMCLPGRPGL